MQLVLRFTLACPHKLLPRLGMHRRNIRQAETQTLGLCMTDHLHASGEGHLNQTVNNRQSWRRGRLVRRDS